MRTGVTLAQLRKEVMFEAGLSTATTQVTLAAERINHMLNRVERELELAHSWPTMRVERDVTIIANSATGTLPVDLSFTNVAEVTTLFGDQWVLVEHGIGPAQRSLFNSSQRSTPIRRWEVATTGLTFEVWPISSQAETLRFAGTLAAGAMANDAATCKLDADVLVLHVAAEWLAKGDPETAQLKLLKAKTRIENLLHRQIGAKAPVTNLADRPGRAARPYVDFIPPAS